MTFNVTWVRVGSFSVELKECQPLCSGADGFDGAAGGLLQVLCPGLLRLHTNPGDHKTRLLQLVSVSLQLVKQDGRATPVIIFGLSSGAARVGDLVLGRTNLSGATAGLPGALWCRGRPRTPTLAARRCRCAHPSSTTFGPRTSGARPRSIRIV